MLSIGKLAAGQERYYEKQVAQGLDDYFTGRGESPGRWLGRGAAELGLSGRVKDGELSALMEGKDPGSGRMLREQPVKVAALDLTFSAPKSVSVLYALAGEGISADVVACHNEAVSAALEYLEDTAVLVSRRTGAGLTLRGGGGFVAAAFRHRMSRALDPQLHTHCVAANLARGPDGRWTALHHPTLFRAAQTAGYLYQAHLRALVVERLGLEWGEVRKGAAELAAIDPAVLEEFSRRRHEMQRAAEQSGIGLGSRSASQAAALATRSRKQYGVDTGTWREEVAARAAEHGMDRARVESIETAVSMASAREAADVAAHVDDVFDRLAGSTGLTELRNTFDQRAVLRALAQDAQRGARVEVLADRGGRFTERRDVLKTRHGEMTTAELVGVERRLVAAAHGRASEGAGRLDAALADRLLAACVGHLNDGQRRAVEATVGSGHGVQVIEALAGTGKTYTAGVLRHVYEQAGYPVLGVAPTGRAVRELSEQAGIPARTLDAMLVSLDRGYELPRGGVVVLDEAGMAPTRQTAVLLEAAQQAGCKVVAIGDPGQLHSVQAGGWMRAVGRRVGTLRLSEVMRQRDGLERRALAALHEGNPREWLEWAQTNDRIAIGDRGLVDRAVEAWHQETLRLGHQAAVLIARDNDTRNALNQRARALVCGSGSLGEERTYGSVQIAVGDRVICRRNDGGVDVDNGTRGTVCAVHQDAAVVETDAATCRRLPADYVAAHVEHAYALTGHGMQGGTVETAFVVAAPHELTKGWSYTALSRARGETRLFVIADQQGRDREETAPGERPGAGSERDAYAQIGRYMRTRDDEELAIEQLPMDMAPELDRATASESPAVQEAPAERAEPSSLGRSTRESYMHVSRLIEQFEAQLGLLNTPDVARLAAAERRERQMLGHEENLRDRVRESGPTSRRIRLRDPRTRERENLRCALAGVSAELAAVRRLRERLVAEIGPLDQLRAERDRLEHAVTQATSHRDEIVSNLASRGCAYHPLWVRSAVGDRPDHGKQRDLWDRAVRGLIRYRLEHDIADEHSALGARPRDVEATHRYDAAREMLARVRADLGLAAAAERDEPGQLVRPYVGILGEARADRLEATVALHIDRVQQLSTEELWDLTDRETGAIDHLDRAAAAQTLRLERDRAHHLAAAEKQTSAADELERRAAELGWRARPERRRLHSDADLQRRHAARHAADADRLDLETTRLREAGRHPDMWLDRHGDQFASGIAAQCELEVRLRLDLERQVSRAVLDPPSHILELIDARPVSGADMAEEWERLATLIERYRLVNEIPENRAVLDPATNSVGNGSEQDRECRELAAAIAAYRQARTLPELTQVREIVDDAYARERTDDWELVRDQSCGR